MTQWTINGERITHRGFVVGDTQYPANWPDYATDDERQALGITASLTPAPSLDDLKAAKRSEINNARFTANSTSFPYAGKLIACDALSRGDIDGVLGVALRGSMPPGWPGVWKATDNTYVSMPDPASFLSMYDAMVAQGAANFLRSEQLKAQVAAATTADEVEGVEW